MSTAGSRAGAIAPWRFYLVSAMLAGLVVLLLGRVVSIQVLNTERGYAFLQDQGEMRSVRTAEIPAYRGVISDRRGEPLAVSTPVISIWADPNLLFGSPSLGELAHALQLQPAKLEARLNLYRGKRFMYLRRHLVPEAAREILALRIPGVFGEREYQRYYPAGEVVAQLVGFTNVDGNGIAGLELTYDDWLRGIVGKKQYIKDLHGEAVRDIGVLQPARSGRDLTLSIDLRLQYLQHRELQRAIATTGAESGSIVTLDSRSGEVLAMVNHPVYNPNSRGDRNPANTRNRAMTDVYEPGSTMKPLTLVAALESGHYTTHSVIDTSPGTIAVGRKLLRDPRDYGAITLSRVIEKSSQVGVTKLALELGHKPIWDVFHRLGIGAPLATGFPGESPGLLPTRPRWRSIEQVTLAFGYGLTATPLQLARAYTVFANRGVLQPVSLLALGDELTPGEQVIAPAIAAQVLTVLHAVTGSDGTGSKARVAGYDVGGKTGTVHKVGPQGYDEEQYIALFAGVAPVRNPRIVTVVVLNGPQGEDHGGGSVAAPVFSRVTQGALRLLNVAPDVPAPVASTNAPLLKDAA